MGEASSGHFLRRSVLLALSVLGCASPSPPSHPSRVAVSAQKGRLPPEVIQTVIRANFGLFRDCYIMGLERDPDLGGNIVTRFVIGLDGRVAQADAADGTTMPDSRVTECVVAAFRGFQFPEPEGGTVTVVYPIMLAPES